MISSKLCTAQDQVVMLAMITRKCFFSVLTTCTPTQRLIYHVNLVIKPGVPVL